MLVTQDNFEQCLFDIYKEPIRGVDTETTSKYWWRGELFSIIIRTSEQVYYFDFSETLPRSYLQRMKDVFTQPSSDYSANAKFDCHFLANEGIEWASPTCILVRERVVCNNSLPGTYNLASLSSNYLGDTKNEAVENYIYEHGLFEKERVPGKKKIVENLFFHKVPLSITQPYGEKDADLHLRVGQKQLERLHEVNAAFPKSDIYGSVFDVDANEQRLIKTVFKMERRGIKVDVDYTKKAIEYESGIMASLKSDFFALTGLHYNDSRTVFAKAFEGLGLTYPRTAKGNPSFNKEALALVDNPIADLIRGIRKYDKRIGTYYSSFLFFRDGHDILHPNINTAGTETGRVSSNDPNIQNIPKEDEESDLTRPFLVRGCFRPRKAGNCFVSIDYKQMEFRLLLDYAGEKDLIYDINEGADPHDATAALTGLSRKAAKTLNFGLLYGMGVEKLAHALKVHPLDAEAMRTQYFRKMPRVSFFIDQVNRTARTRMYVRNWMGRICRINDRNYSYILLNHLIQGGCGDIVKVAMNKIDDVNLPADMLLQVHDELLFESDSGGEGITRAVEIMENVYKPQNGMRMLCSVSHSFDSWAAKDMKEGLPC